MDASDGWLVIRNSELLMGVVDKSIIGSGNKGSLFDSITQNYGPSEAVLIMDRIAKLCSRFLQERGFSIGIDDIAPERPLYDRSQKVINDALKVCMNAIGKYQMGLLPAKVGDTVEETLETICTSALNDVRESVGQDCIDQLDGNNSPAIMQVSGSKGSKINLSQMIGNVGQQIVDGSRPRDGFLGRTLPHFAKNSRDPTSRGFVANQLLLWTDPLRVLFPRHDRT